jgi:hypothetical protein
MQQRYPVSGYDGLYGDMGKPDARQVLSIMASGRTNIEKRTMNR